MLISGLTDCKSFWFIIIAWNSCYSLGSTYDAISETALTLYSFSHCNMLSVIEFGL